MLTFIQAVAREEGFEIPGSRANRNCNPGDLNFAPWQEQFGAVLETIPAGYNEMPRFACFPTPEQGFAAMRELLTNHYLGMTVGAALNRWAPPSDDNDTSVYTANVCQWTGLTPDTVLTGDNIG
jgi:hypothetical protein